MAAAGGDADNRSYQVDGKRRARQHDQRGSWHVYREGGNGAPGNSQGPQQDDTGESEQQHDQQELRCPGIMRGDQDDQQAQRRESRKAAGAKPGPLRHRTTWNTVNRP